MSTYKLISNLDSGDEDTQNSLSDFPIRINESDGKSNSSSSPLLGENINLSSRKDYLKSILGKEKFDSENEYLELKLWRKQKFRISKSLFTFRIAQFLCYGAGVLPRLFFAVLMKQRGLTLVELSSIFSMIFLFQMTSSSIAGIITDKIGNAKPVLMLLMLSTSFILLLIFVTPNINSTTCTLERNISERFNESKYSKNLSSCFEECFINNGNATAHQENNSQVSIFYNGLTVELFDLKMNSSNFYCNFSNVPLLNASFRSLENKCCNTCFNDTINKCVTERNYSLVVVYAILILAFFSVYNTAFRFMNFIAVSLAEKNKSDFGKELAVALCGDTFVIIIVAVTLNNDKESESSINYDPVVCIAAGVIFCTFLSLFKTTVPVFPAGENMLKSALSIIKNVDLLAFILLVFVAGSGYAFSTTFRLIFFESMGAPKKLVALHSVFIILYGFPTLLTSQWWLKKFGANKLFVLCLLLYTVNSAAYSYIYNPWWCLLADVSSAFTSELFWVAVVTHCWDVAPEGFSATLNAFTGSVHYGMGRSSGVFFGGMLVNYMGPRRAYRIMAAIFFTAAILYSLFIFKRRVSPPADEKRNATGITEKRILEKTDVQDKIKKSSALMKVF